MKILFPQAALVLMSWLYTSCQVAHGVKGKADPPPVGQSANIEVHDFEARQRAASLFTPFDARKILGEPAHWSDSSITTVGDTLRFRCTYTANNKVAEGGKAANVYFMYEDFAREATAKNLYAVFKTGNENASGMKQLPNLGDEAFYQSDENNFALVITRKGSKLLRIKVNKLTAKASTNALLETAMRITAGM
jgi:hypothetical protein